MSIENIRWGVTVRNKKNKKIYCPIAPILVKLGDEWIDCVRYVDNEPNGAEYAIPVARFKEKFDNLEAAQ